MKLAELLAHLKRLQAAATKGPFRTGHGFYARAVRSGENDNVAWCGSHGDKLSHANAMLIAESLNALPRLIAYCEARLTAHSLSVDANLRVRELEEADE